MAARRCSPEIIVLGDLHGHYDEEDERFLIERKADLCLFVGDLGDEDPDMAERVATLGTNFRVILGNHDAWESFRHKEVLPRLRACLDAIGRRHLAYDVLDLPQAGVGIVGCRPFSWGGPSLRSPEVYEDLYGVTDHESSAEAIVEAATRSRFQQIVLLAHNGPHGLGSRPSDIYGKDFGKPGGDWGDLDLRLAIRRLKSLGFQIPLVIAGHMHHRLHYPRGEHRRHCLVKPDTVYVNPARVPRIVENSNGVIERHYLSVRIADGVLLELSEFYVSAHETRVARLYSREETAQGRSAV
ncbi:MAG: TIGR04168 family protein [Planctomycetes bacterium]|jgi:uncharacterized protein (TIGR04168 family)|nr:TIGR04168 family protein [Planctomycetota bacterium]MDP6424048.1 TIGR04168 family protein [Planctomycetota bacterium]